MARNIHIYPAPIVNESRISKETKSLEDANLFDSIDIVGHRRLGLPQLEKLSETRRVVRINSLSRDKQEYGVIGKVLWFAAWMTRVFRTYRRSDVTSVSAHSVAVLPLAWFIARSNQAILVYDTHELETETPTMIGLQGRLLKRIERLFIRRCDLVIVVNQGIADWYADTYGIRMPLVVRNIPDEDTSGMPVPDLHDKLGIPEDSLIFIHIGRLSHGRNIPAILNAFAKTSTPHHVVFLGEGNLLDEVIEAGKLRGNIHQLDPVPHEQVVTWAKAADAGFCLTETMNKSNEYALPNKFSECLLAGIPVISTYLAEAHRMLGDDFLDLLVRDVDTDLSPLIEGMTRESLDRFSTSAHSWQLPSWTEEASAMIHAYREKLAVRTP